MISVLFEKKLVVKRRLHCKARLRIFKKPIVGFRNPSQVVEKAILNAINCNRNARVRVEHPIAKKTNLLISFMQNPTGKLTRTTKKHQFEATKTHSTTKSNQRGKIYHLAVDSRGSRSMIRNLKKKTDLVSCIHLNIYRGTGSHLLS